MKKHKRIIIILLLAVLLLCGLIYFIVDRKSINKGCGDAECSVDRYMEYLPQEEEIE